MSRQDLADIWYYVAVLNGLPLTAGRLIEKITMEIDKLSYLRGTYRLCPDEKWAKLGIHVFTVKNYNVYYRVIDVEKRVEVIRVVGGRRDLGRVIKQTAVN